MFSDGFSANTEGQQVSNIQATTKPVASRIFLYGRSSVAAPRRKRAAFRARGGHGGPPVQEYPTPPRLKCCSLATRRGHGGPPVQECPTRLSAFSMIVTS